MKSLTSIVYSLLFVITSASYAQSLQNQLDKYNPYLEELHQGIGILIHKNGETTTANIGNYNFNQHTVFNIGSATKKMTAILILKEVEKGTLQLSDSIGTFLQPIKNVNGRLTIETLLRHRSGLGEIVGENYENNFYAKSDSLYNGNFLNKIPKNNPDKVGKFDYCNTNFILLGHVLEKVTDKSYFNLLQEYIFTPCNMTASYPYVSKNLANLATPIHKKEDVTPYLDYRFFAKFAYAAGSIASTLHDMAKFYHHLFQQKTLLSDTSLQQLISFDDASCGLGMRKFKSGYIGHGGNNIGYSFKEYYNPENQNLALFFSNGISIPFGKMIKNELLNFLEGKPTTYSFDKNITTNFEHVIGKYLFDSNGMKMDIEILESNKQLYLSAQGAKVILISKEKNKLYNGGFGVELEVNPENPNELIFRQNGLEAIINRVISEN
ncbi:hypothetical protein GCM10022393_25480 [Aquimarina addita]|uniref:Beta-lactamase-related domain-containing protein n=1 Tax=Aquimarina addita TaxID=870485 RepID=A0ABP6UQ08_9FLAO